MHKHDKEETAYLIGCSIIVAVAVVLGINQSTDDQVRPANVANTTAYVREAPIFTTTGTTSVTTTHIITTTPVTTIETTTTTDEPVVVELVPELEVVYEYVEEPVIFEEPTTEALVSEIIVETEYIETELPVYSYSATDDEIMLIARVAECEAGYVEEGRRYVIDTILNRVDSPDFPDSISGVIYQSGQFSVVSSAIWNVSISDDRLELVKAELTSRSNYEVGYFRAGYYGPYGTPLFECGGNYFSSIN